MESSSNSKIASLSPLLEAMSGVLTSSVNSTRISGSYLLSAVLEAFRKPSCNLTFYSRDGELLSEFLVARLDDIQCISPMISALSSLLYIKFEGGGWLPPSAVADIARATCVKIEPQAHARETRSLIMECFIALLSNPTYVSIVGNMYVLFNIICMGNNTLLI